MKVIYVAGCYRADDINGVLGNIIKAREASRKLWLRGWAVICPHLNSCFMDGTDTDKIFLDGDLEILRRCDAIYMLNGWEKSTGAKNELKEAGKNGLEIIFEGYV